MEYLAVLIHIEEPIKDGPEVSIRKSHILSA